MTGNIFSVVTFGEVEGHPGFFTHTGTTAFRFEAKAEGHAWNAFSEGAAKVAVVTHNSAGEPVSARFVNPPEGF